MPELPTSRKARPTQSVLGPSAESSKDVEASSASLGAPFFLRALGTHHEGVTLLLLDVAAATPRPAGILDSLSVEEQARAARFCSVEDRLRFGLTRAALRHVLGAATGQAPEALVFVTEPWGKPRLEGADGPHFNVSHSGSLALIGLSRLRPIGVDIERTRDIPDAVGLAEAFFTPREYRSLVGLPPREMESTFFAIWTAKEAVLKALGTGIAEGLRDFTVALNGESYSLVAESQSFTPRLVGVALEAIEVESTYTAAFALA